MEAIKKIERFIFEAPAWKLVLAVAALTLFKTGIWFIPNIAGSAKIALNPFVNPFQDPLAHYLFWNWLGPFVAWLAGLHTPLQFVAFHLAFSLAFSLLFLKVAFDRLPGQAARTSLVIFAALPVSATAYFWTGTDAITLFLMLLALGFPRYRAATFAIGVLLGMQHFEQSVFGAAGLLAAVFLGRRRGDDTVYPLGFCVALLAGVLAGKAFLVALFAYHGIEVNSGRWYWFREHVGLLLGQFFFHFHAIVWSVLGLGWVVALRYADAGRQSLPFFAALGGLLLLLPVSGDQTRVLAVVTFPLVTAFWLFNRDFLQRIGRIEVAVLFAVWAMMPWSWVWGGHPRWSVLPHDLAMILHVLFGWFDIPANPSEWPFSF